ncbi:tetratricopeptide repeat protein [Cystobacter ferrugineus]|uniref:Type III secretion protein n=1 Tax=Cystobacter ferrugineus TaxID=83449 RepID=A0A1L9BAU2_9BACT|nr:tetratricopeptide repeat protein [Cystobacter ferrugineus]OJH39338.1 type III secretion protein [Cystobacter ferrugineus]
MANSDSQKPDLLVNAMQAFLLYEQGRYDEARVLFEELAERDASEGYYRTALGAISLAMDGFDKALEYFNQALQLNPEDTAALINRGEVHLRLGNTLEAARDFSRVVELDPDNEDPLTERARVLADAAWQSAEDAQRDLGEVQEG